jgi:hypothetical protein
MGFKGLKKLYNFSCISVYIKPNGGSQLELKRVAVNTLIDMGSVCD